MKRALVVSLVLVSLLALVLVLAQAQTPATSQQAEEIAPYIPNPDLSLASWLAYDKELPLKPERTVLQENDKLVVYKLYYNSVHNQRVPAIYALPKTGKAPYPAIVFLHGYHGDKEDILEFAPLLTALGYACISIDAEYHGERKVPGIDLYGPLVYNDRDGMIQTVIDLRRAIDYLESVPEEVDKTRIGYAGGSMGGILGAVLAGCDTRIKTAVLWVAGANWGEMARLSQISAGMHLRDLGLDVEKMGRMLAPVDPMYWVAKISPRPVLMLNGDHDEIVPVPTNRLLHKLAKEPKKVVWYHSGHGLPLIQATQETIMWLNATLHPAGSMQAALQELHAMPQD